MGKILVETRGVIPKEVRALIKRIDPAPRGVKPRVVGQDTVDCGHLTVNAVLQVLGASNIRPKHVIVLEQHGGRKELFNYPDYSNPKKLDGSSLPTNGPIVFQYTPLPKEQSPISTPTPEELPSNSTSDLEMELYLSNLNRVPPRRAQALDRALTFICENVCDGKQQNGSTTIQPWHLVEFRDSEDQPKVSLANLDQIGSRLPQAIWNFIHAYETDDGSQQSHSHFLGAQDGLLDATVEVILNPLQISKLHSLAAKKDVGVQNNHSL